MTGKQFQKNKEPRQVLLYRNVFYSRVSTAAVLCLLASFVLQPFERIYASETVAPLVIEESSIPNLAVDAALSSAVEPEPEIAETAVEKPVETTDSVSTLTESESEPVAEDTEPIVTEEVVTEVSDTESAPPSDNSETDPPFIGPIQSEEVTPDTSDGGGSSESSTTTEFTDEEIQELITPADEIPDVTVSEAVATVTENTVAISNVYSDATMQFNKSDCVTVEDGSFYCQVKKEEKATEADGLFAMQDIDGDLEIFVRKNGELSQLTFNTIDDAAPYFDSSSNSIVWHRLINDRYQIISYSIQEQTEVQLTADAVNNMEPSRSGPHTVWQRWNNDNWDIVLYDGTETLFITDSGMHDIAPKVKGDLVMWNRLHPDTTQTIELYDIATKEFTTISDTEGGALSNPRMVLVYETEFENGDVVTKGYDVETGEITPITSKAAEIPDELPEPDATGETRALLPVKNPTKEDGELGDEVFPEFTSPATTTPPTIEPGDLVISSSTVPDVITAPTISTSTDSADFTLDLTVPEISPEEASMTIAIPAYVPEATSTVIESEPVTVEADRETSTTTISTP